MRGISTFALLLSLAVVPAAAHLDLEIQIGNLSQAIAREPQNSRLYLKRGELHRAHADWPAAKADFCKAGQIDPELTVVDFYLGRLALDAGKPKEAKRLLDRLLSVQPDHAEGLIVRARAEIDLGQPEAATRDFTRALTVLDGSGYAQPTYYLERARALEAMGRLEEALRGLDEGLEQLGQPVTLQLYAVELELRRGRHDEALMRLERIAARSPRQEAWLIRRGEILEQAGRPAAARVAYAGALEAIDELPATRRWNRAVQRLEASAQEALERLESPASHPAISEASK